MVITTERANINTTIFLLALVAFVVVFPIYLVTSGKEDYSVLTGSALGLFLLTVTIRGHKRCKQVLAETNHRVVGIQDIGKINIPFFGSIHEEQAWRVTLENGSRWVMTGPRPTQGELPERANMYTRAMS